MDQGDCSPKWNEFLLGESNAAAGFTQSDLSPSPYLHRYAVSCHSFSAFAASQGSGETNRQAAGILTRFGCPLAQRWCSIGARLNQGTVNKASRNAGPSTVARGQSPRRDDEVANAKADTRSRTE